MNKLFCLGMILLFAEVAAACDGAFYGGYFYAPPSVYYCTPPVRQQPTYVRPTTTYGTPSQPLRVGAPTEEGTLQPKIEYDSAIIPQGMEIDECKWVKYRFTNGQFLIAPVINGYMPQPLHTDYKDGKRRMHFAYDLKIEFEDYQKQIREKGYVQCYDHKQMLEYHVKKYGGGEKRLARSE